MSKIRRVSLGYNLGVCAFPSSLNLLSLRITLSRENPMEMSSLPLGFALEVHCSWIKMIHHNNKKKFTVIFLKLTLKWSFLVKIVEIFFLVLNDDIYVVLLPYS